MQTQPATMTTDQTRHYPSSQSQRRGHRRPKPVDASDSKTFPAPGNRTGDVSVGATYTSVGAPGDQLRSKNIPSAGAKLATEQTIRRNADRTSSVKLKSASG